MTADRYVFLDPDGAHEGWIYVIVAAPTGVVYGQQYGGTACLHGEVEGYLVPVHAPKALAELRRLFESTFHGAGAYHHRWLEPELSRLRQAVNDVLTPDGPGILVWQNSD